MATVTKTRRSAEERRGDVIRAAVEEFAERGYHAASTASIAKRAGISQPYIYALFTDKKQLFLACHREVIGRIRTSFIEAARGSEGSEDAISRMGEAYKPLIADRHDLLFQLQGYAAVADPDIGPDVAQEFRGVVDEIRRQSGADAERVAEFMAHGMLINVCTALDAMDICEPLMDEPDA